MTKEVLLVIMLSLPPGETGEQQIAVKMPDELTCAALREALTYAAGSIEKQAENTYVDPFERYNIGVNYPNVVTLRTVREVSCKVYYSR